MGGLKYGRSFQPEEIMGEKVNIDGKERELVKVASKAKGHDGYYTTYRDLMDPDDVEFIEGQQSEMEGEPGEGIQIGAGDPPMEPIKNKKGEKK